MTYEKNSVSIGRNVDTETETEKNNSVLIGRNVDTETETEKNQLGFVWSK